MRRRCVICNKRVFFWHYWFKAAQFQSIADPSNIISVCSDDCYGVLMSAYETGLSFVYVDDGEYYG